MAINDNAHIIKNGYEPALMNIAPKMAEEKPNKNDMLIFLFVGVFFVKQ